MLQIIIFSVSFILVKFEASQMQPNPDSGIGIHVVDILNVIFLGPVAGGGGGGGGWQLC